MALVVAGVLARPAAGAAAVQISITGPSSPGYNPASVRKPIGTSFMWTNNDPFQLSHTVTQGTPPPSGVPGPALFESGTSGISPGGSFTTTLGSGATYADFCRFHPSTMRGRLQLPDKVSPATGSAGTTFTLTVATANALSPLVYDIQRRVNGGAWTAFHTGTTTRMFTVRPATAGTYDFHSRLRNTSNGAKSGYSPIVRIIVT